MVKKEPQIKLGEDLLRILDDEGYKPSSFLWFYVDREEDWRLIFSSKKLTNKKEVDNYVQFIRDFSNNNLIKMNIPRIAIVPNNHNLLKLLRIAIKTDKTSISGIRFSSNTINGQYIDDAYIYRLSQ